MKTMLLPLLLALVSLGILQAEVEPVNIVLHGGDTTYRVPAGKVLMIEHFIWANESDTTTQRVAIFPAGLPGGVTGMQLKFPDAPDIYTPARPIRIVEQGRVAILQSATADWRDVMITGLLVDKSDLYAATIKTELNNPRMVGGRLLADATFDSPRPRVTKVEASETVDAFAADASSDVEETRSPDKAIVSVAASGAKKIMRVTATARAVE